MAKSVYVFHREKDRDDERREGWVCEYHTVLTDFVVYPLCIAFSLAANEINFLQAEFLERTRSREKVYHPFTLLCNSTVGFIYFSFRYFIRHLLLFPFFSLSLTISLLSAIIYGTYFRVLTAIKKEHKIVDKSKRKRWGIERKKEKHTRYTPTGNGIQHDIHILNSKTIFFLAKLTSICTQHNNNNSEKKRIKKSKVYDYLLKCFYNLQIEKHCFLDKPYWNTHE